MNYSNEKLGYGTTMVTTGYSQVVDTATPVQPRFESVADQFANLPAGVAKAVERLRILADRYGGSVPEAVSKAEANGTPSNLASRLEMYASDIETLLGKLHNQIDRLERF